MAGRKRNTFDKYLADKQSPEARRELERKERELARKEQALLNGDSVDDTIQADGEDFYKEDEYYKDDEQEFRRADRHQKHRYEDDAPQTQPRHVQQHTPQSDDKDITVSEILEQTKREKRIIILVFTMVLIVGLFIMYFIMSNQSSPNTGDFDSSGLDEERTSVLEEATRLGEVESSLIESESDLREREAELAEIAEELNEVQLILAERETEIQERERTQDNRENQLTQLESTLDTRETQIANREASAGNQESTITNLQTSSSEKDAQIQTLQSQVNQLETDKTNLNSALLGQDTTIQNAIANLEHSRINHTTTAEMTQIMLQVEQALRATQQ